MINYSRLIKLTQRLIRISSQNPPGDERSIAIFVKNYLEWLGLKPKIYEFKKRRSNVVAVLKGINKEDALLVTPHLDTVPQGRSWKVDAFGGKILKGRLYGLGASDCKGNLACALEAIQSLVAEKRVLGYNLVFAATADEEAGSQLGLIPLLKKGIIKVDAAVVLDASDFELIVVQKGLLHLKVKIQGRRAHGAYPWQGENAIASAVDILERIKNYKFSYQPHKYLHPPSVNIGTIRGGDKVNIVADWCEFELDLRFLPGMSIEKTINDIKKIIKSRTKKFKLEIEGTQKPYEISSRRHLINSLRKAMHKLKLRPKIRGSEGATTITFFQDYKIPAVATGFGSSGCAHIANEYVRTDNLFKGAKVLEEFLKDYARDKDL